MITLKRNTPIYGDEMAGYEVLLDTEYTLSAFVAEVITKNEWGRMIIKKKGGWGEYPATKLNLQFVDLEYKKYKITKPIFPHPCVNDIIETVIAHGGWGCMDYSITLHNP